MDVVLEVFDTFMFDWLYATVYPASTPVAFGNAAKGPIVSTSTFSSMREVPTAATWYAPSTQYFQLQPSPYAYLSGWPRDNVYRQALSLYLITW